MTVDDLNRRLVELQSEHQDLDVAIQALRESSAYDTLQLQRLKKRKLRIKDEIARIQDRLTPDIIA